MSTKLKDFVKRLKADGFIVVSDFRKASVKEYLSPEEQLSVSHELARANQEFTLKKDEAKQIADQMKAELKQIEAKVELNSSLLVNGYRMILKPVVVCAEFRRRVRIFLDPETGEEVGTEPLMDSDYQMRLDEPVQEKKPDPVPEPALQLGHDGVVKVPPTEPAPLHPEAIEADYEVVNNPSESTD